MKNYAAFSKAKKLEPIIRKGIENNDSLARIALQCNICYLTLRKYIALLGIMETGSGERRVPSTYIKRSEQMRVKLQQMADDGFDIKGMVRATGHSAATIRKYVAAHEIPLVKTHSDRREARLKRGKDLYDRHRGGISLRALGAEEGISGEYVRLLISGYLATVPVDESVAAELMSSMQKVKTCVYCGNLFRSSSVLKNHCSILCRKNHKRKFCREDALTIIRLRKRGSTWDQVAAATKLATDGKRLKSLLLKYMPFFSKHEQAVYFPKREPSKHDEQHKEGSDMSGVPGDCG